MGGAKRHQWERKPRSAAQCTLVQRWGVVQFTVVQVQFTVVQVQCGAVRVCGIAFLSLAFISALGPQSGAQPSQ